MPLSPRQVRFYAQRADIWRFAESPPGPDGKFLGRAWSKIGSAVPCQKITRHSPQGPAGGLIQAEQEMAISMDDFDFAADAQIDNGDEFTIVEGDEVGVWWGVRSNPLVRTLFANLRRVQATRIEAPSPGISG